MKQFRTNTEFDTRFFYKDVKAFPTLSKSLKGVVSKCFRGKRNCKHKHVLAMGLNCLFHVRRFVTLFFAIRDIVVWGSWPPSPLDLLLEMGVSLAAKRSARISSLVPVT